jgi:hypothetical protein
MKFELTLGTQKYRIEYYRNCFWGTERLISDGKIIATRSPISPSTHFSFSLLRRYEFTIGEADQHQVVFEKKRPLLLAGFRPHNYRIFLDGVLVHEQTGY